MKNNNKEVYKTIKGYEYYEVSNKGNVRSIDRTLTRADGRERFYPGQEMKLQYDSISGRPMVRLYNSELKKAKTFKVHRLVALTFLGERPEGMDIRHLDGVVTNNNVENLCYGTKSSNQIDIMKHTKRCAAGKLTVEDVVEIRRAYKEKEMKQYELAEVFGITQGTVSEIVNRKTFKFINDDGTIDAIA